MMTTANFTPDTSQLLSTRSKHRVEIFTFEHELLTCAVLASAAATTIAARKFNALHPA
jgi:hypothetical protein